MSKEREKTLVQEKLKRLQEEVSKQQTIIGQASQALNLCNSTIEFSGSREQVEGERLLLVASKFILLLYWKQSTLQKTKINFDCF